MTPVILQFKPVDHRRVLTIFREVSFHYLKLINFKAQAEIFWEKWEQILERGVRRIIVWYSKIPHEDRGDKLLSFWVRMLLIFKDSENLILHQSWLAQSRKGKYFFRTCKVLPFSCTHLDKVKDPRYMQNKKDSRISLRKGQLISKGLFKVFICTNEKKKGHFILTFLYYFFDLTSC